MKRILLLLSGLLLLSACAEKLHDDLVLESEERVLVESDECTFDILVHCPSGYENVNALIPEDASGWMSLEKVSQGKNKKQAVLTFSCRTNRTTENRQTVISLFSDQSQLQLQVQVIQRQWIIFKLYKDNYTFDASAARHFIPLECSVDFETRFSTDKPDAPIDWIKYLQYDEMGRMSFELQANDGPEDRSVLVELLQTDALEGQDELLGSFTILQRNPNHKPDAGGEGDGGGSGSEGGEGDGDGSGSEGGEGDGDDSGDGSGEGDGDQSADVMVEIKPDVNPSTLEWAVSMENNRLFPTWSNSIPDNQTFTSPVSNNEGSAEVLICPSSLQVGISTVMGVEGKFLLRFGNQPDPQDPSAGKLYLVTGTQSWDQVDYTFSEHQWYHIALTWKDGLVKVYINAKECCKLTNVDVDVNSPWSYENNGRKRCWWFGYSYDPSRSFYGKMAEFRIWKTALTPEILHEPNHYFQLPMDKYGQQLIGYWKVQNSKQNWIENMVTTSEYSQMRLFGETDVCRQNSLNKGTPGIERVAVSDSI